MAIQNPFPGMNPYLEQYWRDVHQRLITYACDQLQPQLPGDLRARMEERVYLASDDEGPRRDIYPDVRVRESESRNSGGAAVLTAAPATPLLLEVENEPITESFLEVREVGNAKRVVTVIEVLSLTNKLPGEGRRLYTQKQRELRAACVSLVEIDLLRDGPHVLHVPLHRIPRSHRTPYLICVRRGWTLFAELYRAPLRERLPVIGVPLRETDQDVKLDLQALVDQAYCNGRYDDIDYRRPPEPPLDAEDAAWAEELLRSKGLRGVTGSAP